MERGGWLTGKVIRWYKRVLAEFIIRGCGKRDLRWFLKIWVECKAKKANLSRGRGAKPQVRSGRLGYRLENLLMNALWHSPAEEHFCLGALY